MSSSAYNNLDLKTNKVVTLGDIFVKGFEKRLSAELEKSFRATNGLKPKQALTEILFENKIEHTDNFILTDKAIIFCYNPYEIAAYAFGQVRIPIQLANIKDILK